MNKFGQLIAGAAIAALSVGTLGSGFLVLTAHEAAAKSDKSSNGSSNGNKGGNSANAGSKSQGKALGKGNGKGQYHKVSARYLKNLNAMCSNGKSQSPNSNVYKINAFFTAQDAVDAAVKTIGESSATLSGYSYVDGNGDTQTFGSDTFVVGDAIAYEEAQQAASADPATYDTTNLDALGAYQTASGDLQGLQDTARSKLGDATRSQDQANALMDATEGPLFDAYQSFLQRCGTRS